MLDQYAVMGNPISHSLSPKIHTLFAEQTHQSLEYKARLIDLDGFRQAVHDFKNQSGKGLNITIPFKTEAYKIAEHISERAEKAKAVNTLSFKDNTIYGDNTDGIGLIHDLKRLQYAITAKTLLIIGAGGATQGILNPLLTQKPQQVILANRTLAKAESLANLFQQEGNIIATSLENIPEQAFDGIIHTTALGHQQTKIHFPKYIISPATWVYDISYGKAAAPFLDWAEKTGATDYSDGLGMLVGQAAEAFYIWRDVRPDITPVLNHLKATI